MENDIIVLIACTKTKNAFCCEARDLYTSEWFRSAYRYATSITNNIFILSAEHHLIPHIGKKYCPYDTTLNTKSALERRKWAEQVLAELGRNTIINTTTKIILIAGLKYKEFLLSNLLKTYPEIDIVDLLDDDIYHAFLNGRHNGNGVQLSYLKSIVPHENE